MKYGHFDVKRREYVIDRVDVPVSWTNYLGVEELCAVVNHTAGGYLFYQSPEHHRITRFRPNGVPMDRPGHYLYLRDDETGEYWSVSWQPCGGPLEDYRCRHGLSYSVYECVRGGIRAAQTLFIPRGENVELWDLALENTSGRPRPLSVYSYAEFSYHQIPIDNQNFQMSLYCAGSSCADGIIDYELFYEHARQFMAVSFEPDGFDCLRDSFLGPYRTEANPLAVERGECFSSFEKGGSHCAVLQKKLALAPGETARLTWMLGEGGRGGGGAPPGEIPGPRRRGRGPGGSGPVLGRKAVQAPGVHPRPGPGRDAEHLEPVPERDQCDVLPVRLLHRGGGPHRAGLPGYRPGRHDHPPLQPGGLQKTDCPAPPGADLHGLRASPVRPGLVWSPAREARLQVPHRHSRPGQGVHRPRPGRRLRRRRLVAGGGGGGVRPGDGGAVPL